MCDALRCEIGQMGERGQRRCRLRVVAASSGRTQRAAFCGRGGGGAQIMQLISRELGSLLRKIVEAGAFQIRRREDTHDSNGTGQPASNLENI
ncbi:uncharacterized protein VTP21DRAFT_3318 [Calcarisporiella thermophila]|uniref:uncharacterized protein n=1 Tax=Calcarisporiella thermophila TaxID=911321 RepID=UPI0037422C37